MGYTIASILPRVVARLNDFNQSNFTNDVLTPYAQDAADEMQLELELNGILALEKITSTPIVIPKVSNFVPGQFVSMSSLSLLPSDMLEPQAIEERLSGSTDLFRDMVRRMWTPDILPTDSLRYWNYREEDIFFLGATTNRDIVIKYLKRLVVITDPSSTVSINNSQLYMITKIAALAARFVGENETRASELDAEALTYLNKVTRIGVKSKQGTRTRRRPFSIGRRNWT